MNKLRRLSKIFAWAAIVTFVVAFFILMEDAAGEMKVFRSDDIRMVGTYILFMIPVIFASMAVSLRFIAKAIDPDYKSDRKENREVSVVLPPD